jgi:hypothetical protein
MSTGLLHAGRISLRMSFAVVTQFSFVAQLSCGMRRQLTVGCLTMFRGTFYVHLQGKCVIVGAWYMTSLSIRCLTPEDFNAPDESHVSHLLSALVLRLLL